MHELHCLCAETLGRQVEVDDVVLPLTSHHELRRMAAADRRQVPAADERTGPLGVYRHASSSLAAGQQPALAVVRPTVSRLSDEVRDKSHHQRQQTTRL